MDRTRTAIDRKSADKVERPRDKVDIASEDSFPASDPPAFATPQPEEPIARQQADAKPADRKAGDHGQADWKAGKAIRGDKKPAG